MSKLSPLHPSQRDATGYHCITTTQCGGLRSDRDFRLPLHDDEDFLHVLMVVRAKPLVRRLQIVDFDTVDLTNVTTQGYLGR